MGKNGEVREHINGTCRVGGHVSRAEYTTQQYTRCRMGDNNNTTIHEEEDASLLLLVVGTYPLSIVFVGLP